MRNTGSSRTGMPWRLSEPSIGTGEPRHQLSVIRRQFFRVAIVGGVILAGACARPSYTAPYQSARLNTFTVRDDSEAALRGECERLLTERTPATGEAMLKLEVAATGAVTEAQITRSSGDARVDDIFGKAAARLQFDPMPDKTTARIKMGFSCAPGTAVTTMSLVSG